MTRKAENQYVSSMHRHLPSETELHREKMNNPYRRGTADWWYSGDVLDLWIEFKYMLHLPKRPDTVVVPDLSPLQVKWCSGRARQGRFVLVVLGLREGAVIFYSPEEWEQGLTVRQCQERLISRGQLAGGIKNHCCFGVPLVIQNQDGSRGADPGGQGRAGGGHGTDRV